jgi:hypothetical protein
MTAPIVTSYRPGPQTGPAGFGLLLRAEWIKFRTVRGWVIGVLLAGLVTAGIALLDHSSCGGQVTPNGPVVVGAGCSAPVGPGGEAVTDSFYFVHRPLAGRRPPHRPRNVIDRRSGPGRPGAVVQGRDHHPGEHPARIGLRGDDSHRRPWSADAV